MWKLVVLAAALGACREKPTPRPPPAELSNAYAPAVRDPRDPSKLDPDLVRDREQYIEDVMAFSGDTRAQVLDKTITHNTGMKDEWEAWEKAGPWTDDRIKQFYKQTKNYIYDLGGWHLWDLQKRSSDVAMIDQLKALHAKNVLDFGGGPGFNALLLAQAGFDVTLADLDSVTLKFGMFRAERQNVKMKYWKTDVEEMPPDKKYDAILCLDVLEHLPEPELRKTVDKLIQLKHDKTEIIIHAPFGRTATHPMHLDLSPEKQKLIERLKTEQPKS